MLSKGDKWAVQLPVHPLTLKTFSEKPAADASVRMVATRKSEGCIGESKDSERLQVIEVLQAGGMLQTAAVPLRNAAEENEEHDAQCRTQRVPVHPGLKPMPSMNSIAFDCD